MNKVIIPRENVSDNEYKIVTIYKGNNDLVNKNDIIGEIESSKALIELLAEESGYFFSDRKEGEMIAVGEVFALISAEPIGKLEKISTFDSVSNDTPLEEGSVITQKAGKLIESHGISIVELKKSLNNPDIISERDVLKFLDTKLVEWETPDLTAAYTNFSTRKVKRVAIIGGGTGAIQVIDLMLSIGEYLPFCIFDDTPYKLHKKILGVPVISRIDPEIIERYFKDAFFDQVIIAISTSIPFREKVFKALKARNIPFANLVHNSVYLGVNVQLGEGNIILPQCHIGPCAAIGDNNFITAKASIEHNNIVGDHCTFGPGVMTSGNVTIGNKVKFGAGIFVEPNIKIGDNSIISSGSIITKHVEASTTVINNKSLNFKK